MSVDKSSPPGLVKGSEIDLYLEKLAFGGKALGRVDGLVVFADQGSRGRRCEFESPGRRRSLPKGGW